jgi:hypothetical protein
MCNAMHPSAKRSKDNWFTSKRKRNLSSLPLSFIKFCNACPSLFFHMSTSKSLFMKFYNACPSLLFHIHIKFRKENIQKENVQSLPQWRENHHKSPHITEHKRGRKQLGTKLVEHQN